MEWNYKLTKTDMRIHEELKTIEASRTDAVSWVLWASDWIAEEVINLLESDRYNPTNK